MSDGVRVEIVEQSLLRRTEGATLEVWRDCVLVPRLGDEIDVPGASSMRVVRVVGVRWKSQREVHVFVE